jgi:hypothetical protein
MERGKGSVTMHDRYYSGLRSQKGAALLIMFLILFMVSAAVLLKGMGSKNPLLKQQASTIKDLASAKEALLADAVMSYSPGKFKCPDTNHDGVAEVTCGTNVIGRLPIEFNHVITTDQQFWYALTDAYHGPIINSTTSGALSLNGQNDIVALIIAPGQTLNGQTRPNNTVANYLESGPVGGTMYSACSDPDTCNDIITAIRRRELMSLVTPMVIKEMKKGIDQYHVTNSEYPPDQATFLTAIATVAPWIANNNWASNSVTIFTRSDLNTATLKFTDCNITYTLTFTPDKITRSQNTCQ